MNKDDIRNLDGTIKQHITVIEKKTGKQKRFPLCNGFKRDGEIHKKYASRGIFI